MKSLKEPIEWNDQLCPSEEEKLKAKRKSTVKLLKEPTECEDQDLALTSPPEEEKLKLRKKKTT